MAITFRGMHFLPPGANSLFEEYIVAPLRRENIYAGVSTL